MLFRLKLTFFGIGNILRKKNDDGQHELFCLRPGLYEVRQIKNTIMYVSTENVKTDLITNDITTKVVMNLHTTKDQSLKFVERSFFNAILGFTRTGFGVGINTGGKPVNLKGFEKII